MPKMVLGRNHILRGLTHDVRFVAGEPVDVHKSLVTQAASIGATMLDGAKVDVLPEDVVKEVIPEGTERKKMILAKMKLLAERNQRGDFNASSLPDLRRLNAMVGFEITGKERMDLWQEYKESLEVV